MCDLNLPAIDAAGLTHYKDDTHSNGQTDHIQWTTQFPPRGGLYHMIRNCRSCDRFLCEGCFTTGLDKQTVRTASVKPEVLGEDRSNIIQQYKERDLEHICSQCYRKTDLGIYIQELTLSWGLTLDGPRRDGKQINEYIRLGELKLQLESAKRQLHSAVSARYRLCLDLTCRRRFRAPC